MQAVQGVVEGMRGRAPFWLREVGCYNVKAASATAAAVLSA